MKKLAGTRQTSQSNQMLCASWKGWDYLLINMPSSSFNDEGKLLAMFDNLINVSEDTALKKIIFNTSMYVG